MIAVVQREPELVAVKCDDCGKFADSMGYVGVEGRETARIVAIQRRFFLQPHGDFCEPCGNKRGLFL